MRKAFFSIATIVAATIVGGCDTSTPNSPAQTTEVADSAKISLNRMEAQDPSLANDINNAYGYAIFPNVGAAAVGIGGASGQGVVYRGGQRVGSVTLNQASIGVQIGGDTFAELLIFQDDHALNRLMNNSVEFGADANATLIKAGAAGSANFANGVKVFVLPKGGLMAGVNINGQKFVFTPAQQ